MKHISMLLLLAFPLSGVTGCKLLFTTTEKQPIQAPPLKVTEKVTPVQPDEITPANAQSKARQLLEEIENDSK